MSKRLKKAFKDILKCIVGVIFIALTIYFCFTTNGPFYEDNEITFFPLIAISSVMAFYRIKEKIKTRRT